MNSRIEHGKIESDIILSSNNELILHGMIVGNVYVKDKSKFTIHGTVTKNLFIEDDSQVFLHGTVAGNVICKGGKLIHFGTINGTLTNFGGEVEVKENSVVKM